VFPTRILGDWIFPWGLSGPFGNYTPGRWLGLEEALETYSRFFLRLIVKRAHHIGRARTIHFGLIFIP